MSKRIFLDDIEQVWVSLDTKTNMMAMNNYNRDLIYMMTNVLKAGGHAKEYWRSKGYLD